MGLCYRIIPINGRA